MKTLEYNPDVADGELSEKPLDLPSLDFVKSQTASINGRILLVGLSTEQAEVIKQLAEENNIEISDTELSDQEFDRLSSIRFPNVTEESRTLYLGRGVGNELKLYRLLS